MAKIHIIGVNHFDPAVRPVLVATLRDLAQRYDDPPGFIAVEYDEGIFRSIASQRARFAELVEATWPAMERGERDMIASSLLYEADAHLDVFPDVPTIWLDAGREWDGAAGYSEQRFKMYVGWIGDGHPCVDAISKKVRDCADTAGPPDSRDRPFAARVLEAISRFPAPWSVVVVGWAHTRIEKSGTMANRLKRAAVEVERHEAWTPRSDPLGSADLRTRRRKRGRERAAAAR